MALTADRPVSNVTRSVTAPGALHMTSPRGRTMRWVSNVVLLVIAGVLALVGKKDVEKAVPPVPTEAIAGVQADIAAVKQGLSR